MEKRSSGSRVALARRFECMFAIEARPGPDLGLPLLGGGALLLLAFYRHAWDGADARGGQTVLLLNLVPAACVLTATALDALAR